MIVSVAVKDGDSKDFVCCLESEKVRDFCSESVMEGVGGGVIVIERVKMGLAVRDFDLDASTEGLFEWESVTSLETVPLRVCDWETVLDLLTSKERDSDKEPVIEREGDLSLLAERDELRLKVNEGELLSDVELVLLLLCELEFVNSLVFEADRETVALPFVIEYFRDTDLDFCSWLRETESVSEPDCC